MWQELLQHGKGFIVEFCRRLRGADRRAFQAEVATEVCGGSPRRAESMFGWSRKSVEKGLIEQEYDVELQPHFGRRGRRACEVHSPVLADVVTEVLDAQSQADPKFQTNVLFTRATGKFLRSLWESHPDLADARPPSVRTCQRLMNRLGFRLRFVQKARPLKKIPETDAIFTHLDRLHDAIESDPTVLRISVDTKAKVAVGPYCRHGRCRSRTSVKAADHDMHPEAKLVPLGILEVDSGQLFLSLGQSAETSDFIADGIEDWWLTRREAHLGVRKIVIDLDNGPNVQSHRTQFMKRLIEFADKHELEIELVYYPPYHSKYNPVERCWSSLERHWNGTLLIDVVCNAPRHCRDGAW